jgi:hypothetical protein
MADDDPNVTIDPGVRRITSEEELRASFSGPAFNSNRFYSSTVSAGLRIAFMKQHGKAVSPIFRTAVLLSFPDAIALRNLLIRQLKDVEPLLKEAEAEAAVEAKAAVPTKNEVKDHGE